MIAYYIDREENNQVFKREGRSSINNMDRLMKRYPSIERITESEYHSYLEDCRR